MRIIGLFLLTALALASCAPSEAAVQEAIRATEAARPSPEPSPVPSTATTAPTVAPTETAQPSVTPEATATVALVDIDLEPLLLEDGDLPEHLDDDFVDRNPEDYTGLPAADSIIEQSFYDLEADMPGGAVTVRLYENAVQAGQAYSAYTPKMDGLLGTGVSNPEDLGERAKMEDDGGALLRLAFLRCQAFVLVAMRTNREFDIVNYAQRLDERLTKVVCPADE